MASITSVKSALYRTGSTVEGDIILDVNFTETEARLNIGFVPTVFATPTLASTQGIEAFFVAASGPHPRTSVPLDTCRKEVVLPGPTVYPAGQTKVTATFRISTATANFFGKDNLKRNVDSKWPATNAALDLRVDLTYDISGSKGAGADQRLLTYGPSSALVFNGVDTYVDADFSMNSLTSQATVELWMRGAPQGSHVFFVTNDARQRVLSAHVPYSDGNVYFDGGVDANGNFDRIVKQLSPADSAETWNHWAFVRDSIAGRMAIYRNGVLWHSQDSGLVRPMTNGTRVVVGAHHDGKWPHAGAFTEFRLWNTARTDAQIKDNMTRRVSSLEPGLIVSYALASYEAGKSIADTSGNNRNGTMRGTPQIAPGPSVLVG